MSERAFKYHGLGNDFLVLDHRQAAAALSPERVRALCDRRRGVGADGILEVLPSTRAMARMVVHNADGSVAEMCGNGLRCVAKFLADRAGDGPERLPIETGAGVLDCRLSYAAGEVGEVELSMGPARLVAPNLPSGASGSAFVQGELGQGLRGTAVSMGNPHLVLFDRSADEAPTLGPRLERHPLFPERTNVEWVALEPSGLDVVVWERGVGLTLACGTGACAAVVAAHVEGRVPFGDWVRARLPGGNLEIRVAQDLSSVLLRGPATFVFEVLLPCW